MKCQTREFSKLDRKPKITNKSDILFVKVKVCWLCDCDFITINDKVNHFCRLPGKYLGAAYQPCVNSVNKNNQYKFLHVLYHNFSRYDNHMFFND